MKIRLAVVLVGLALGFDVPTFAQQKEPTPSEQCRQQLDAFDKKLTRHSTTAMPPPLPPFTRLLSEADLNQNLLAAIPGALRTGAGQSKQWHSYLRGKQILTPIAYGNAARIISWSSVHREDYERGASVENKFRDQIPLVSVIAMDTGRYCRSGFVLDQ